MKILQKGFTLIELLVVIAIIGILSSVVLASLNSARNRGANATIKSNLANFRAQAELIQDNRLNSGSIGYAGAGLAANSNCPTTAGDTTIFNVSGNPGTFNFIDSARSAAGGNASAAKCVSLPTGGPATSWMIWVTLRVPEVISGTTYGWWCADSNGSSKPQTTAAGSNTQCP